jgi:hypothetical protein
MSGTSGAHALPMTTLADDVAMLDHIPERVQGPVVVAPELGPDRHGLIWLLEAVREVEGKENSHG